MKKIAFLLIATLTTYATFAQVTTKAKVAKKVKANNKVPAPATWTKGGVFSLNVNQAGFDNWIPAGDADWSIGANAFVNIYANRTWTGKKQSKPKSWSNSLEIAQVIQNVHNERTDVNQFNKLDDRIDLLSKYSIGNVLSKNWGFAATATARTQLYDTKMNGKRISGFFAPAVVTVAPGFEYMPNRHFSFFIAPLAMRWIFVSNGPNSIAINNNNLKPFGVDPTRGVDVQPGGYVNIKLDYDLDKAKKINLKSRLDLYSNYANNPECVDAYFTNILTMKVNKWIAASINLTMIYDDDIKQFGFNRNRPGLQYNHNIGIGITRKF